MTKKQFTLKNWDDYAEGDCIYYNNGEEMGTLDVLDTLNNLNDENKQLTKEFNSCSHNWALMYDEAKNKVEELSKENKQLKEQNRQLRLENGKLTHDLFWANKRIEEELKE